MAEHADRIGRASRDGVRVVVATVRSETCDVESVDAVLSLVEDVAALDAATTQNVHRTRMNQAAYDGRLEGWKAEYTRLGAFGPRHEKPSVDALNAASTLSSALQSGLYLDAHAELEDAIRSGRDRLLAFGFTRFAHYFDALEAAYLTSRGRLAGARVAFERAREDADFLTRMVNRRTSPYLALALGDDTLVERVVSNDFVDRERAAVRAHPSAHHARLFLGGYAIWLDGRGFASDASELLGLALDDLPFPSPRFAPLVAYALRHVGARRVPGLETFVRIERLAADDAVGRATAELAGAALAQRDGREDAARNAYRAAATSYERLGFSLCAAHAYHLGGAMAEARELYERCGAAGYTSEARSVVARPSIAVDALSGRERTAAGLVTLGLTNLEVAERMSVSTKTIEKYLSSIFRKLGVRSRTQLAAHVATRIERDAASA